MKRLCLFLLCVLAAGCGAHYSVTRTAPDGTVVAATATVSEKQGRMAFTFTGDPAGAMTISLEKENVEPVSLPGDVFRGLVGSVTRAGPSNTADLLAFRAGLRDDLARGEQEFDLSHEAALTNLLLQSVRP